MSLPIPEGPDGLTPDWLSAALGHAVASVTVTRIGEDEGFTGGALYRLEMPDQSLIAKLSPTDPVLRKTFASANAREVNFYREWSNGLPVPVASFAAIDTETGASIVMMDDLGAARAVPFARGADVRDVEAVLATFARIHAAWWEAPTLSQLSGAAVLKEHSFAKLR